MAAAVVSFSVGFFAVLLQVLGWGSCFWLGTRHERRRRPPPVAPAEERDPPPLYTAVVVCPAGDLELGHRPPPT